MKDYNFGQIERKWQDKWSKDSLYQTQDSEDKPKYYILDMFPYPSGAGLHVGHPKGYIATDIVARMKMLQGYNVLHPMGWDAFGLPAENFAIKNKVHPREMNERNIATFKSQLEKIGFSYDWNREINTTDPEFYKWTQWIFLQMFKKGLAYESYEPINWCPSCQTGLANEDLEDGRCERCDSEIEQKPMRQWVLKITDYAERMLNDLEKLPEWDNSIKEMQKNWIGKSEGALVKFEVRISNFDSNSNDLISENKNLKLNIEVFTTRIDTIFSAAFVVVAPEHRLIEKLKEQIENYDEVIDYVKKAKNKTDLQRTDLEKDKTGVELKGIKAINPANNKEIPVWIADFVLGYYGTGAVFADAHDERDFEFAKKYNIPLTESIAPLFTGTCNDKPRKDKKTVKRRNIEAIIKHWEKDEYFCLNWKFNNWKSFIIGGIEKDESIEDAAIREIKEESGYQNMKVIKNIGYEMHSEFFAPHKDINRYAQRNCVYIELLDGEYKKPRLEDIKNHNGSWIKKEEVDKFLTIKESKISWDILQNGEKPFTKKGILINSEQFNGMTSDEAMPKIIEWLRKKGLAEKEVNYKLKDWVFSRQRYWGEPIPIIHCEKCGVVPVPEKDLPVVLPEVESYEPTGTGESPLANIKDWVNTKCPKCDGKAKRETNTMPQWAGSSWYYLRYIDPHNDKALVDKDKEKYWSPVDFYVGGAEHATRHLIYARFWHKFLFDIGMVNYEEPFIKLQHVGLIMAEDGRKMSKRWGNVINPDDIVEEFGADAMRVYEMFMGPFAQSCDWSTKGLIGAKRFLEKVWRLFQEKELISCEGKCAEISKTIPPLFHKTIKKVGEDIESMNFNTAISQMMIFVNECSCHKLLPKSAMENFLILLSPFAPHIAEEIWTNLGHEKSIFLEKWPEFNPNMIKNKIIEMVIQVNGKVRDKIQVSADISETEIKKKALASEKIQKYISNQEIKKVIFVPGKIFNLVVE